MCERNEDGNILTSGLRRVLGACWILVLWHSVAIASPTLDNETLGYGLSGLLAGTGIALPYLFVDEGTPACGTCDPYDIPGFDRWASGSYNADANALSHSSLAFSLGVPVANVSARLPGQDSRKEALILTQSLSTTFFTTQIIKVAFQRARPFTYSDTLHGQGPSPTGRDARMSFPSGHTSMAFAGLVTTAALRTAGASTKEKVGWYGGAVALGSLTGALRIVAGKHYWTDVLGGALLGTGIGLLLPWLHQSSGSGGEQKQSIAMPLMSFSGAL